MGFHSRKVHTSIPSIPFLYRFRVIELCLIIEQKEGKNSEKDNFRKVWVFGMEGMEVGQALW